MILVDVIRPLVCIISRSSALDCLHGMTRLNHVLAAFTSIGVAEPPEAVAARAALPAAAAGTVESSSPLPA
jgi:hypothetical protein